MMLHYLFAINNKNISKYAEVIYRARRNQAWKHWKISKNKISDKSCKI